MIWNVFRRGQQPDQPPAEHTDGERSVRAAEGVAPEPPVEERDEFARSLAPTRGGLFGAIRQLFRGGRQLDAGFWDELEELLLASDVGAVTTARLTEDLREIVRKDGITEAGQAERALQERMVQQLEAGGDSILHLPDTLAVVLVVGVNGVGKTTSIAKLATWLQRHQGRKCLLAAGDTFRAGAIDQLKIWGERAGCQVVAHQAGADPGAVAFDAIAAARSRGADCVIVDTAGRLHTKFNLMTELQKVRRTIERREPGAPHETLLVLDAVTGQNAIIQARVFTEAVGVTGVVLAKLDSTSKGGAVLSVAAELGVPIKFAGTGERLEDLAPFDPQRFVTALFQRE